MALTEVYVDPSIAGDSGDGLIGTPYGDLEYAIEQETFDATNGTRVNIKAGTDEVLAAEISTAMADTGTSIAWVPSAAAPLVFRGYTATAGDGGVGSISGGGSVAIYANTTHDYVSFIDLELHNVGAATYAVQMDDYCNIIRCHIHDGTGNGVTFGLYCNLVRSYITDITGTNAVTGNERCFIGHNHIDKITSGVAIVTTNPHTVYRNIVSVSGTADGITCRRGGNIISNSIYSAAGTGQGIQSSTTEYAGNISNNLVEGFSGAGGVGIDHGGTSGVAYLVGNAVYDCTTEYDAPGYPAIFEEDNETLSASPFTDAANGDFSPVDTGSVKEGALPSVIGGGLV